MSCNFIKNETLAQVFSYEFCEISKNTFFPDDLNLYYNPANIYLLKTNIETEKRVKYVQS